MSTAEAPAGPQALPGDVVGGRYRLDSILGQGGMGTVWRATHLELGIEVAVKLIPPDQLSSPVALARFRREARAAAALKSAHVVAVHDYGDGGGCPYLVMELLPGEDLRARLDRVGRLAPDAASVIFDAMCKALRVAHDAGIVHRDLKPGNVYLARSGDEEIVKVLDFGVAKELHAAADTVKTASDALIGSPRYMSPEQVRGSQVDHRSDLWSAAVVLYEMVVGQHPFSGETVGDVLLKIAVDEIERPSSIVPGLSPAIDAFFEKALERRVDRRFADATTLSAELRAAVHAAPTAHVAPVAPFGREDVTVDLPRAGSMPAQPPSPRLAAAAEGTAYPSAASALAPAPAHASATPSDPDATAPALTRRIVTPPGWSRRLAVGGLAAAGALALAVAALVVGLRGGSEPTVPTTEASAAPAASPVEQLRAPQSEPTPPTSAALLPSVSATPPAPPEPSAPSASAAASPLATRPPAAPGHPGEARPPARVASPPPPPAPRPTIDPTFGVEDTP